MLNLIVNIIFGYGLETIYCGYVFNKIKNIKSKKTYLIFLISYILGSIIVNFTFNNIFYLYIVLSFVFGILSCLINKTKFNITDVFIMLNLLLVTSLILAIPILFIGYNKYYLIINIVGNLILLLISKLLPLNKYYKIIVQNWNRTSHNKIKSVTVRNLTLIIIYFLISLVNIFLNVCFLNIYSNIL